MKEMLRNCLWMVGIGIVCGVSLFAEPLTFSGTATFDPTADYDLVNGNTLVFSSGTVHLAPPTGCASDAPGDRVIVLTGANAHAYIKIGATTGSGSVTISPGVNPTSTEVAPAILVFDVIEQGSILEVQVLNDLIFQSNGLVPMHIGVRGKGKVQFRLPCGKNITLTGANWRVLMEQNLTEQRADSQLSFDRWSLDPDVDNGVNLDTSLHSIIRIGQNSSFSFISQVKSGLVSDALNYGYGSVSFDPSNSGTGRMILQIDSGSAPVDFTDGAFMIYGSYVLGSGVSVTDVQTSDMRNNVTYKYRAGINAAMRIGDALVRAAYSDTTIPTLHTYLNDPLNNRGLVVLNYNNSYPLLANNYDQTRASYAGDLSTLVGGLISSQWFVANTVQNGFVLGNNGTLEIENNRFLDYFACRTNASSANFPKDGVHVPTGATESGSTHAPDKVKLHNPSAFIIDGNAFRKTGTTAAQDPFFEYDATDTAQIILRGNAGIVARVAADNVSGALLTGSTGDHALGLTLDTHGMHSAGFSGKYLGGTIGQASYDGFSVLMLDDDGAIAPEISYNGEVAIDIEGQVTVTSTATFDQTVAAGGYINVPTLLLGHDGRELAYKVSSTLLANDFSRPLPLNGYLYPRYNNSQILVNDIVTLDTVRLIHNDVGRDVSFIGTGNAVPAVVGGELPSLIIATKLFFDPAYWVLDYTGSPIYLINSTIECHESFVSAGVRWVVRDNLIDYDHGVAQGLSDEEMIASGDNISSITLYNRGHAYDLELSGLGRYFQLGSRLNTMADGVTLDPLVTKNGIYPQSSLRDAFIDVFRQNPLPAALVNSQTDPEGVIKLSITTAAETGVPAEERAIQAIHIADRSTVNVGWAAGQYQTPQRDTFVQVDSNFAPWEFSSDVLQQVIIDASFTNSSAFLPYANGGGVLEFAGDNVYVSGAGRYDSSGIISPAGNELIPRNARDVGGILYANFGGTITASGGHDMILDTVIGRRTCAIPEGAGIVSIPEDQFIFQSHGRVETCGFDPIANASPRLVNQYGKNPIVAVNVNLLETPSTFEPVKGIERRAPARHWPYSGRAITRSTDSVTVPVTMPSSGMMVMASGDTVDQAQVFGSTRAKPFHLYMSGDGTGFSRVREFVTMTSDPVVLGEGMFGALFLDNGARIGLGSRSWNANSVNAWNQLGLDKVTIYPNGNGVVDLNSDILITDKLPLIATENFGNGATPHQLVFYSDVPREIRVPANGEIDLSSFCRGAVGTDGTPFQQIVFSGETRLVLEPGAKIRFPNAVTHVGPALRFIDNSQLVIMSNLQTDAERWVWATGNPIQSFDNLRVKFLGIGHIILDGKSKMTVYDNALVGVESDAQTYTTDITINIVQDAQMLIGDTSKNGGSFQVGNILDGGLDGTNARTVVGAQETHINFSLIVNGDNALCRIGRNGFFGLGAGIVNKVANPNGTTPNPTTDPDSGPFNPWQVQSLWNVKNISLRVLSGYFDHNQIFDGSATSKYGSVFAIGPIDYNTTDVTDPMNGGKYTIVLGDPTKSFIRGGGNLVFVDAGIPQDTPLSLNIWSDSAYLTGTNDSGKYTILAPSNMIYTYTTPTGSPTNPTGQEVITVTVPTLSSPSTPTTYTFQSSAVTGAVSGAADTQGAALVELYNDLSMPIYGGYKAKYVPAGPNGNSVLTSYLVPNPSDATVATIVRATVASAKDNFGNVVSPQQALASGYFVGSSPSGGVTSGAPETYRINRY